MSGRTKHGPGQSESPVTTGEQRYAALLRGVNVGGKNKLPMADLRDIFTAAGCAAVQTYIQSGNVVFEAAPDLAGRVPEIVTRAIRQQFARFQSSCAGDELRTTTSIAAQLTDAEASTIPTGTGGPSSHCWRWSTTTLPRSWDRAYTGGDDDSHEDGARHEELRRCPSRVLAAPKVRGGAGQHIAVLSQARHSSTERIILRAESSAYR